MGKFFRAIGRGIKKTFTTKAGLAAVAGGAALAFVPGLAPAVIKGVAGAARAIGSAAKTTGSLVKQGSRSSLVRGIAKRLAKRDEQLEALPLPELTPLEVPEAWEPESYATGDPYLDAYEPLDEPLAEAYDPNATEGYAIAASRSDDLLVVREPDGEYFLVDPRTQTAWELDDETASIILVQMRAA